MRRLSVDQITAERDARIARAFAQDAAGSDTSARNWASAARWNRARDRRLADDHRPDQVALPMAALAEFSKRGDSGASPPLAQPLQHDHIGVQ